jgi:hypothetical protein
MASIPLKVVDAGSRWAVMRSIRRQLVTIGIAGLSALLPAASSLVISEGGSLARAAAVVAEAPAHTRWSAPKHTRWSGVGSDSSGASAVE